VTTSGDRAGSRGYQSALSTRVQNRNLSTSSTVRDELTVEVIVPKVLGALMSRAGGPKLGVLVTLNASARNSNARDPPALNRLASTASVFRYPGARATPTG